MKKTLLVVAMLTMATALTAQDYDSTIKRWHEGPLTWEDFTTYSGGYPIIASLEYGWHGVSAKPVKTGNLRIVRTQTELYMNPVSSWVNPDYRNPGTLQYMQTAFDYAELCRRQLQREIDNNVKGTSVSELSQFYYGKADRFIARMREETDQGRDTAMVRFFAVQTADQLAGTPDTEAVPEIGRKKWGMAVHYGYGNDIPMGEAANYLRTLHGLKWGFDISYGNVSLYWHMLLAGAGKTRQEFVHDGATWRTNRTQNGGNMEFDLAYNLVDTPWFNLSPFAGIGAGFYQTVIGQDENNKNVTDGIAGFRYLAGLSMAIKVSRTLDLSSRQLYYYGGQMGTTRSYDESSIRLLAYAAHTSYEQPVGPTWSLNFGLAYNIHSWNLR